MDLTAAQEVFGWFLMRTCLFALATLSGLCLFAVLPSALTWLKSLRLLRKQSCVSIRQGCKSVFYKKTNGLVDLDAFRIRVTEAISLHP